MCARAKNTTPSPDDASFVARLAEKISAAADARLVYSDPVERDGVTVIPVAKARWGFGGGAKGHGEKLGEGGGGGVQISPVGFIEIKDGQTEYKRITEPSSFIPLVVTGGAIGWILLRALRKLFRG